MRSAPRSPEPRSSPPYKSTASSCSRHTCRTPPPGSPPLHIPSCRTLDINTSTGYTVHMSAPDDLLSTFLNRLMERRHRLPSQMAADLGVSHATVSRWLSGKDLPSPQSCRTLAEYADLPVERVLSIVGHLPPPAEPSPSEWPEFRDYVREKYGDALDDDLVRLIEDLLERRRRRAQSSA